MTMTDRAGTATTTQRGVTTSAPAPATGWAAAVQRARARRAANRARAQLERDLLAFSTPAERLELEIMLARHEPAEVADIHRILDRLRAA